MTRTTTFEGLIKTTVTGKVDDVPEFSAVVQTAAVDKALLKGFMAEREGLEDMEAFEAEWSRARQALAEALPPDMQETWLRLHERQETMLWIRQEIAYALGVEVGRKLAGGR